MHIVFCAFIFAFATFMSAFYIPWVCEKSDENWIKSRVNGAWNSGFKNGYAFAKDEMQENIIAELQRAYNEGWNAGYSFANNEKSNTVVRNENEIIEPFDKWYY